MQLTLRQEKGLKIAIQRFKDHEKCTIISGYAGTGKSTLVNYIVAALGACGIDIEKQICYGAFTGKACQVLQKKGAKNVLTLHKLLYTHKPMPDGKFLRVPNKTIDYPIVIVDEVSMAPKSLMQLLFTHDVYVICLGDPFQLPPINKNEDNHLLDSPHIFLDEIMRQAADNDIIRLSMDIREQRPLSDYQGSDFVKVFPVHQLSMGMLQWADQVLVSTNATRQGINNQMRDAYGREGGPQNGDKVICVRNYWDTCDTNENPLINGAIGYIEDSYTDYINYPKYLGGNTIARLHCNFITDTDMIYNNLSLDKYMITNGQPALDKKTAYIISKNKRYQNSLPYEFLYGYAITCHKSQGSQWEKVLVIEEKFPFDKIEHARWLYTAITRAEKKVLLGRAI